MSCRYEFVENTVIVRNLPDFVRGCSATPDNNVTHLGMIFQRITARGKRMGYIQLADDMVIIICPDCVAEITYRNEHSEAVAQPFGTVTHKTE